MIKTLVFDFGDVFLNLDKKATALNLAKFDLLDFTPEMWDVNKKYEKGLMSTEIFINFYLEQKKSLTRESFVNAWNSILIDFPKQRLEFIKKLKEEQKYRLILLSNTNDLHIKWVEENIFEYPEFKACFDQFYLSHEINFRKPDTEIFQFVLDENNLKAEETFFVDDTKEHTISASKLGLKVWHLNPSKDDITELFTKKSDIF